MTPTEYDLALLDRIAKGSADLRLSEAQHLIHMARDLVHVDRVHDWVLAQDAEFRGKLLFDLQCAAAEEDHMERQRLGAIDRSYADSLLMRGGHLVGGA